MIYVWTIASVAALGGLLFGYDWVVIGGAKPFYEAYFRLTSPELIGWVNSCALVGCLVGSLLCGTLSDHFGRKKLLLLSAFLFAVSSVFTGWAHSVSGFVAWRIIGGVAIGMASNVSPNYIAEISPAPWRGRLVALNQLAIVIGILAAQIVNWLIAQPVPGDTTVDQIRSSWNGQWGWRWMFTAVAAPSVVFFLSALVIPESPRWLAKRGRTDGAREVLSRIGGSRYSLQVMQEITTSLAVETRSSVTDLLRQPVVGALLTGILLAFLQQWSGINIIFYYAAEIYRDAGYGINDALFNIVITGVVNLLCTVVAFGWIDRFGRRSLLIFGCAAIALSHGLLGLSFAFGIKGPAVVVITLMTIGFYAMSLGPVTWVLVSEIFPNRVRGMAISVAVSSLWIACFLATFTFPMLNRALGAAGTFWIYGAICLVGLALIKMRVSETKGKTLEEIERDLAVRQFGG